MNLNKIASKLFPDKLRVAMRNQFYLRLPVKKCIFHYISSLMPTFLPTEGYLKEYIPRVGDFVVDAGAFPGNFAIVLSRLVGTYGLVIAIEPDEEFYHQLVSRFNKLALKNIVLLNVALWNSDGRQRLVTRGNEGSSLFSQSDNNKFSNTYIQTKRIDTIISELGISKVDYLKMDIEGAEIEVLEGAHGLLLRQNLHLAIACYHIRHGQPTSQIISKKLKELNYQIKIDFPKHLTLYGNKTEDLG